MAKEFYRRNLPHWHPPNAVFFITISLEGSLPKHILNRLKEERDFEINKLHEQGLDDKVLKEVINQKQEFYFGKFDALLDNPQNDVKYLANPKIAKIVTDSLHYLDGKSYKLICYTIMSNHIHFIIYKVTEPLYKIMMNFKGFTGREANKILNNKGHKFWNREYYDRVIRDRREFTTKVKYVLFNPVKAKLVENWSDWKFSWIRKEFINHA